MNENKIEIFQKIIDLEMKVFFINKIKILKKKMKRK